MVAELQITTLGSFDITINHQPIPKLLSRKVELLLLYLAVQTRPQPREVLSELLWDDQPQERAMTYLRTALANLQKSCADYLHVTRHTIGINPDSPYSIDILNLLRAFDMADLWLKDHALLDATAASALEESLTLYQGAFLKGVYVRGAAGIDSWITAQNSYLQQRLLASYQALGEYALACKTPTLGIGFMQQALELDPLHESSQRLLMRLYLQGGQRTSALVQYEQYRDKLAQELQVEPLPETNALYHQMHDETLFIHSPKPPTNNLPTSATPFIARPGDMEAIESLMCQPTCRLISLVGLGGVGKTRLAIEIARQHMLSHAPDGVFYISLPMLDSPDQIAAAMIHALKLPSYGHLSPQQEIFQYLWQKQALVILDNLEATHENALFLSRLMAHADRLQCLVTARGRLNLQEEWVYSVQGLAVPLEHDPDANDAEAVQLFLQAARRHRTDTPYEREIASIIRICQAVEGIPLAIELAAPWVRLLSTEKIAAEIERNIDFLAASTRNVPERHRSMRAVFDSSFALLNEHERMAFCRLAVFRNGFTQVAAEEVAQVDLFTLLALLDWSLLQVADGRYTMHEMLRHYAYEKLSETEQIFEAALDRHADYYAHFFEHHSSSLMRNPDDPQYSAVMNESQNFMHAWERIRQRGDIPLMGQLLRPFFRLFDMQNRYVEGQHFFRQTTNDFQQAGADVDPFLLARAKILLALCSEVVNQYAESEQLAHESLPIFLAQNSTWDLQLAHRCLGRSAYARGSYAEAQEHFEQSRALLEHMDDPSGLATVLLRLSDIAGVFGNYEEAKRSLEHALRLLSGPTFKMARIRFLTTLGDIHIKLGELDAAEGHLLESQELCQLSNNLLGLTVANSALGRVYTAQGRLGEAVTVFQQSIQQCKDLKHTWGRIFAQIHLGHALILQPDLDQAFSSLEDALSTAQTMRARWLIVMAARYLSWAYLIQGNYEAALQHLSMALRESIDLNAVPVTLEILAGFAMLQAAQGQDQAGKLAACVASHPLCEHRTRLLVEPIQRQYPPEALSSLDVSSWVQKLLTTLDTVSDT